MTEGIAHLTERFRIVLAGAKRTGAQETRPQSSRVRSLAIKRGAMDITYIPMAAASSSGRRAPWASSPRAGVLARPSITMEAAFCVEEDALTPLPPGQRRPPCEFLRMAQTWAQEYWGINAMRYKCRVGLFSASPTQKERAA